MAFFYWRYPLSHPSLSMVMRDSMAELRFYGVVLSRNIALGFILKTPVPAEEEDSNRFVSGTY